MSGPQLLRRTGEEYDVDDDEARRMIERGIAEPVAGAKTTKKRGRKTATAPAAPERAESPAATEGDG